MSDNELRNGTSQDAPKAKKARRSSRKSVFEWIDATFDVSSIITEKQTVVLIPKLLLVFVTGVIYIMTSHWCDRLIREQDKVKKEIQDVRFDYTTLKAQYMKESKLSEMLENKTIQELQLNSGQTPPYKIEIEEQNK